MPDALDRLDNRFKRASVAPRNKSLLSQAPIEHRQADLLTIERSVF